MWYDNSNYELRITNYELDCEINELKKNFFNINK